MSKGLNRSKLCVLTDKESDKIIDLLLDQTTIIFGRTNSGKTVLTSAILKHLSQYIPKFFGILGIPEKNIIAKMIPNCYFSDDFDVPAAREQFEKRPKKKHEDAPQLIDLLNAFWYQQELLSKEFAENKAKIQANSGKLRKKFINCLPPKIKMDYNNKIHLINTKLKECLKNCKNEEARNELKKTAGEYMIDYAENLIIKQSSKILRHPDINSKEKEILKWINSNTRLCIIFDDVLELINEIKKEKVMTQLATKGRHRGITTLMLVQEDTLLENTQRKNAHVLIFCDKSSLSTVTSRQGFGFTKKDRERLDYFAEEIFDKKSYGKYAKLMYAKFDEEGEFYYVLTLKEPLHSVLNASGVHLARSLQDLNKK